MKNNGRGGMQSSKPQYSIYCPKCGKPAARVRVVDGGKEYLHFTKQGSVWHKTEQEATP